MPLCVDLRGRRIIKKKKLVLGRALDLLRDGKPARLTKRDDAEEERHFQMAQLLTAKPVLYVCNVEEASAANGNALSARVFEKAKAEGAEAVVLHDADALDFLGALGAARLLAATADRPDYDQALGRIERFAVDIPPRLKTAAARALDAAGTESGFVALRKDSFGSCRKESIDYAVMEKAENVYIIPSSFGWSDLGTWNSAHENMEKDYLGNAVSGSEVMVIDATHNMVHVPNNKLVLLQGLNDYIIVDTEDVLMICKKEKEQEIKQYVAEIKRNKGDKYL